MSDKADYITAIELEHIAAACRTLSIRDAQDPHDSISIGPIPVGDSNGESLGFIEIVSGEARFVPEKWRTDD